MNVARRVEAFYLVRFSLGVPQKYLNLIEYHIREIMIISGTQMVRGELLYISV